LLFLGHPIALLALATTLVPPLAGAGEVAADRQVLILTRALAYDGNLKNRAGPELVIAVLGKAGNGPSEQAAESMTKAFKALGSVKVQGLPLKATHIGYSGPTSLTNAIEAQGIDVLYLSSGLDAELPALLELAREKQVITMGGKEEYIGKGASLGVFTIDAKPTIYVNLTASKREGAAFGSDLLRLAKVIR
jgi:hypothetical protein